MGEYRVDPDGVLGVLAGVDDLGSDFESAKREIDAVADDGVTALAIDDRVVMSRAWSAFMSERRSMPGKVMHIINVSAQAVGEATLAILAGDAQMAADMSAAQSATGDPWRIGPSHAYSVAAAG